MTLKVEQVLLTQLPKGLTLLLIQEKVIGP